MIRVLDIFSGIGGFSLGLESTGGFRTVGFCEIEPFCREVLRKHWPDVPVHEDIREFTAESLGGLRPDAIVGGFPCQDISVAGRGAGIEGARSGLWSEMFRLVRELRPRWVIAENVPALRARGSDRVLSDLEGECYSCWPLVVGAWAVGAPHRRDRVWIVAHRDEARLSSQRPRWLLNGEWQASRDDADGCGQVAPVGDSIGQAVRHKSGRECGSCWAVSTFNRDGCSAALVGDPTSERPQGNGRPIAGSRECIAWSDGEASLGADGKWRITKPGLPLLADGIPRRVERLRSTGNAVVPQVVAVIGQAILSVEAKS